jgi:hypothetical protein
MTHTVHTKRRCNERGIRIGQVEIVVKHGSAEAHASGYLIFSLTRRQVRRLERLGRRAGINPQLLTGIGKLAVVVDPTGSFVITAYRHNH